MAEAPDSTPKYDLYHTLARILYLAAGLFVVLWFLDTVTFVLLFFFFAVVLALALNPLVTWLEDRSLPRWAGTLLVFLALALIAGGLGWLVVPRLLEQASSLVENFPEYAAGFADNIADMVPGASRLEQEFQLDAQSLGRILPTVQSALLRAGRYTLSLVGLIFMLIVLVSTVIYMLIRPRPLIRGFLDALPEHQRAPAARAFTKGSESVVGWIRANVIVGVVEAVASAAFLTWMGVPGAIVWASLTLFAEMIPKLGPYLMTIPPVLVSLAVDPMTALWVLLFYMALNEFTSDFIAPVARSSQMDIHPVSLIFVVLVMGSAFGLLGAVISTPLTGFIKAFYEELYLSRHGKDPHGEERVEAILHTRTLPIDKTPPRDKSEST